MKRRRRCGVCAALFMADPRVGSRQRTCGEPACKAAWHRKACDEWREREAPAIQERQLRARLGSPELSRAAAREAMGPKAVVVLEEVFRLAVLGSREAFASKQLELSHESFRLVGRPGREATAAPGSGP